ncbi:uncharacterized protein LOC128746246 [Sabethes cyaneus]|uniref:uncharacterized protein LOC128746246 n=1 Tax=Sabethes cyaneus TaxID=53552 RepID=UPI00237E82A0|nr:uncharacterized protein LOC128746246 [Sabethes cyaneus]
MSAPIHSKKSEKSSEVVGENCADCGARSVVTEDPDMSHPGRACQVCREEDTDEMVQCDSCSKWHHFQCVGVTQEIENFPWSCAKCEKANGIQENSSSTCVLLQRSDGHPKQSSQANMPTIRERPSKHQPKAPSVASSRSSQALARLELEKLEALRDVERREAEKQRAIAVEEAAREKAFVEKKFKLLALAVSEGGSMKSAPVDRTANWVATTSGMQKGAIGLAPNIKVHHSGNRMDEQPRKTALERTRKQDFPEPIQTSKSACPNTVSHHSRPDNQLSHNPADAKTNRSDLNQHHSVTHLPRNSQQDQCPLPTIQASRMQDQEDSDLYPITRKQLAALQAVSKDLPVFSGSPEEWPLFFSTFNSTTAMCGFTDEENVVRLQRCLSGRAYEAVKSRLLHPSNVDGIMSTLRMLFGQPEVIVNSMIAKINSLPTLKEDKLESLIDFAVSIENFCAIVDACGVKEYFYNVTFLHQLVNKLPPSLKLSWAQHKRSLPTVNLPSFSSWLYSLAEAASSVTFPSVAFESKPVRSDSYTTKRGTSFVNAHSEESASEYPSTSQSDMTVAEGTCLVCKGNCKSLTKCKRFLEFARDSRWATVRDLGLCRRCLRRHSGGCQAKACGKNGCELKHHELLHNDQKNTPSNTYRNYTDNTRPTNRVERNLPGPNSSEHGCNIHQVSSSEVLFRYLPIVLYGKHTSIPTFAFLDNGSELTLLDKALASELQLEGESMPLCLHWTGGAKRREENSKTVKLELAAKHNPFKKYTLNGVRTVDELLLPPQTLNVEELKVLYPHLKNLPIESYHDIRPRILIGMKDQHLSLVRKSREGAWHQPIAVKTRLGWTVCGGGKPDDDTNLVHSVFHVCAREPSTDEDLHSIVKQYFAIESLGIAQPRKNLLSSEEERAQSLLATRTVFKRNRYETGLLWRYDNVRLPDSRPMAVRRLEYLRKRMDKDPELAKAVNQKMIDLIAKGYVRKLTDEELKQSFSRVWYLPMFPVTNVNKPGKIRMVWDAAAASHGITLNSVLLKGPDQLCDLFTILIQFRVGRIGLTGDVREMFLQVLMRAEDQQCQRFLWYDEDGTIAAYVLQVMSFGACCSPSSAQFVKNLNAERFRKEYPDAVEVIQKRHYVDDMLVSVSTEQEAIQLAQQVKRIHAAGGFEIRNWVSNSTHVVRALQAEHTEEKSLDLSPELATEKVLGMWWCTKEDTFTYKVGWYRYGRALLEGQHNPTKREMLRILMSVFDPLGLIAHFLMYLKVLLQDVWRAGIDWDERIDGVLFEKWQTWLKVLPQIERISIPRCYGGQTTAETNIAQLHTFVDAGENGIAAACYLRFTQGEIARCSLVAAKTKVAPLKFVSTPRLELQAALVGARLSRSVSEALTFRIFRHVYWSDSQDVLYWINSDHRRYSSYVACRVSEILDTTEMDEWRYVPSDLNVADDGTKWKRLPDLSPQARWFNGPDFLRRSEDHWPRSTIKRNATDLELRPSVLTHFATPARVICVGNFSNWTRLLRVVAMVYRFFTNCKSKLQKKPLALGHLSSTELSHAESYIIRQAQHEGYPHEVALLQRAQLSTDRPVTPLPKTSPLYQKSPWLDNRGIMRMRGRISACHFATEDAKQPIILPRDHHATSLIIAHYHDKYHHQNHETVINEIRQKYSIPKLRIAFAKVRSNCQRCKNNHAMPTVPIMAELPAARLDAFSCPFSHVGVDFFGPYEVVLGRRTEKRWGMLATCLTIRAIHIEIVHSLNTDSCVMALRNFICRRGKPLVFYSDRGTNFIGANKELQTAEQSFRQEELMKEFEDSETSWQFLPPASPHMGGSWERLIGSVKKNLMAILLTRKPTDEVLRNLFAEVENTINARPLTHVPTDDDSAPALTPNDFLLGSSNGVKPLCTIDGSGVALRQGWRLSQAQANCFWKRWVSDYLPEITRRTKWFVDTKPIENGDIVVIVDPKLPRNCWPKGRILCTHPGRDGQPRSATVRTASGIYERPVAKLAVLDVRREAK